MNKLIAVPPFSAKQDSLATGVMLAPTERPGGSRGGFIHGLFLLSKIFGHSYLVLRVQLAINNDLSVARSRLILLVSMRLNHACS